jgi:hypothetical protein
MAHISNYFARISLNRPADRSADRASSNRWWPEPGRAAHVAILFSDDLEGRGAKFTDWSATENHRTMKAPAGEESAGASDQ